MDSIKDRISAPDLDVTSGSRRRSLTRTRCPVMNCIQQHLSQRRLVRIATTINLYIDTLYRGCATSPRPVTFRRQETAALRKSEIFCLEMFTPDYTLMCFKMHTKVLLPFNMLVGRAATVEVTYTYIVCQVSVLSSNGPPVFSVSSDYRQS